MDDASMCRCMDFNYYLYYSVNNKVFKRLTTWSTFFIVRFNLEGANVHSAYLLPSSNVHTSYHTSTLKSLIIHKTSHTFKYI